MAERLVTHEDYNQSSREILMKVDIYFNGKSNPPLTVLRGNYLVSGDILEESGAETANPLGAVSSNELTFSLYNEEGKFNPANTSSIYYGQIKLGLLVKPYFKINDPDIIEWDPMGEFYVADWIATPSGIQAEVTAYDKLQSVFRQKTPIVKIEENQTFFDFFTRTFEALNCPAIISEDLTQELLFTYLEGPPLDFLQQMVHGSITYCNCDKQGQVRIKPFSNTEEAVVTFTDSDQIMDIVIQQSVVKTYDGVELTYYIPQVSEQTEILGISKLNTPTGTKEHEVMAFQKTPVKLVSSLSATAKDSNIKVIDYTYSPSEITITTENLNNAIEASYSVSGIVISNIEAKLTDDVGSLLKIDNIYVQSVAQATQYKNILNAFTANPIPIVEMTIRGNPLLNIGDKITIQSNKYSLNYTGIILRAKYIYIGSLTCELTLLNSLILGGH